MRITITDLRNEVKDLNERYAKRSKYHLVISYAYGGYSVHIRAKDKYIKLLGSGVSEITCGHDSARNTIDKLMLADSRGWINEAFKTR